MRDPKAILECIKQFQKFIECAICLDELKDPVETRCGHTFCGKCIYRTLNEKNSVACPLCKKAIRKRSLKKSAYLSNVINAFREMKMVSTDEINSEGETFEGVEQLQSFSEKVVEKLPLHSETAAASHPDLNASPNFDQKFRIQRRAKRTPDLLDVVDNLNLLKRMPRKPSGGVSCAEEAATKIPSIESNENDSNDPFVFPISQNDPETSVEKRKKVYPKRKNSFSASTKRNVVAKKRKKFANIESEPKNSTSKIAGNLTADRRANCSKSCEVAAEISKETTSPISNGIPKENEAIPDTNSNQEVVCGKKEIPSSKENTNNKKSRKPRRSCTKLKQVKFSDKNSSHSLPAIDDNEERVFTDKCTNDLTNPTKRSVESDTNSQSNNSGHGSTPVTASSNQGAAEKVSYWLENVDPMQVEGSEENVQAGDEKNNPQNDSDLEEDLVSISQVAASQTPSMSRKQRKQFCQEISRLKKEAAEKEAAVFGAKPKQQYTAKNASKDVQFYGKTSPNTQEMEDDFKPLKKTKRLSKLKQPNSKQKTRKKSNVNLFDLNGLSQGVSPFSSPTKDENSAEEKDTFHIHDDTLKDQTCKTSEAVETSEQEVAVASEGWSELDKCLKIVEKELINEKKLEIEYSSVDSTLKPEEVMVCNEVDKASSIPQDSLSNGSVSQHQTSSSSSPDSGVKHAHLVEKNDEEKQGCHSGNKNIRINEGNTSQISSQQSKPTPMDDLPKTTVVEAIVYSEPKATKQKDFGFKVPSHTPLKKTPTKWGSELLSQCSNGIVRLEDMPIICVDETQDGVEVVNSYYVQTMDTPGNSEDVSLLKTKDEQEKVVASPCKSPTKRKTIELGIFDFSEQSEGAPGVTSSLQSPSGQEIPQAHQSDMNTPSDKTKSNKEGETEKTENEDEIAGDQDTFITPSVCDERNPAVSKAEDDCQHEQSKNESTQLVGKDVSSIDIGGDLEKESVCQSSEETTVELSLPMSLRRGCGPLSRDSCADSNIIENTEELAEKPKSVRKSMPLRSCRSLSVSENRNSKSRKIKATSTVEKLSNNLSVIEETPQVKHVLLNSAKKPKGRKCSKSRLQENDTNFLRKDEVSPTSHDEKKMNSKIQQPQASSDLEDVQLTLEPKRNLPESSTENDVRSETNVSSVPNVEKENTQSSDRGSQVVNSKSNAKDSLNSKEIVGSCESRHGTDATGIPCLRANRPHERTNTAISDNIVEEKSSSTKQQVSKRNERIISRPTESDILALSQNDDAIPSTWPRTVTPSKDNVDSERMLSCGIIRNVSVIITKLDEHKLLEYIQCCGPAKRKAEPETLESNVSSQDTVSSSPLLFAPSQSNHPGVSEAEQKSSLDFVHQSKTIEKLLRHIEKMKILCKGLSDFCFPISTRLTDLEKEIHKISPPHHHSLSNSSSSFVQAKAKRINHVLSSSSSEDDEPLPLHNPSNNNLQPSDESDIEIYSSLPATKALKIHNIHFHNEKSTGNHPIEENKLAYCNEDGVITIGEDVFSSLPKQISPLKQYTADEQNLTKPDLLCSNDNSDDEVIIGSCSSIVRRKRILSSSDEEEILSQRNNLKKQCRNVSPSFDIKNRNSCPPATMSKSLEEVGSRNDVASDQASTMDDIDQVVESNISTMKNFPQSPPDDQTFEDDAARLGKDKNVDDGDITPLDRMEETETMVHDQYLPVDESESACESLPPLTASQVAPPTPPPLFQQLSASVDTSDVDNLLKRISEITGDTKGEPTSYLGRDVINVSPLAVEQSSEKTEQTQITTAADAASPLNASSHSSGGGPPMPADCSGLQLVDKTNTSSSCTPCISDLSTSDVSMSSPSRKLGIMVSGLRGKGVGLVKLFTKKWRGKFYDRFVSGEVTHVIVKTQDMRCDRTLKYLQAVASKIWVVSISWITQSLKQKALLTEDRFEVLGDNLDISDETSLGPRRSRLSPASFKLLSGYVVHCIPPFALFTQAQFIELLRLCGARVVASLEDLAQCGANEKRIITVDPDAYSNDLPNYSELGVKYKAEPTSCSWVLDCIATFRLQSPSSFPIEDMDSEMM